MIAQWMLYSVLTASLVTVAALAVEAGARATGRAVRWVWAGAPVISVLVPVLALVTGGRFPGNVIPGDAPAVSWSGVPVLLESGGAGLAPAVVGRFDAWIPGDAALAAIWLLGTVAAAAWYAGVWRRLARASRTWRRARVSGNHVHVSRDGGPAAVGLVRPSIVIPEWLLSASESAQRVVLLHEAEHVRCRDNVLLALAPLPIVLLPWNPALWWQARRLRVAVELDCDRRVLARGVDVETYASLLLQLAARPRGHVLAAALGRQERRPLETRLRAMTRGPVRWRRLRVAGSTLAAVVLLAVACEADPPPAPAAESLPEVDSSLRILATRADRAGDAGSDLEKLRDRINGFGDAGAVDVSNGSVSPAMHSVQAGASLARLIEELESGRAVAYIEGVRVSPEALARLEPGDIVSLEVRRSAWPGVTGDEGHEAVGTRVDITTRAAAGGPDQATGGGNDNRLARLLGSGDPLERLPADGVWLLDGFPATKAEAMTVGRAAIARIEVVRRRVAGADAPPEIHVFTRRRGGG